MSSTLFAFQVARPLESASAEPEALSAQYDPQTQTLLWQGQDRAQAYYLYCTAHHNGWTICYAPTSPFCNVSGPKRVTGGYVCDFHA